MATITEDFVTIANIIKHEIHKCKKQKKLKENLKNVEEDEVSLLKKIENKMKKKTLAKSGIGIFEKKKKKKKRDKKMVQNDENMNNDLVTLKVDKFYNETCGDNYKDLYKDETMDSNFNKNESTRRIPMSNASEGDSLFEKKKKKKKRDKKMVQNDENMNNDLVTLKVDKFYNETCGDSYKDLYKDETMDSNFNKNESTRRIPMSNASEGDSLFKDKKKKKKRDTTMVRNGENFNNDIVTLQVEKFCNETCDDNDNFYEDELTRSIPIANDSEGDSLFEKKKKKKKRDKKMVQNDENMNNDLVTLNVDKFYNETCGDNYKDLYKDETMDSNFNKNESTRRIPMSNASEGDSLFEKKKKKKKRDKKMVQNDENMNNDLVTLNVDKFYNETCGDNYKDLYKDETMNSNFNKNESTRRIPMSNASEGDSLFEKKKKKKKRDKKMVQNDENMNNDLVTLKVDKFYNETCGDNYKDLYKDETMDSNFNKNESTRRIPMSNASEGDSLFEKKKKKKKRDKKMVQNDENMNNDLVTLKVDKFYNETCGDSYKDLYKDETMDSNFNKNESTRRIPMSNASEGDSLFKDKKKKKKRDTTMVRNGENFNNDIVTLQVEKFCNETCDDNDNFYEDELTRSIPIANDSEGDSLFEKKKKKKKRDKKMVQNDENMNNDLVTLNVDKFYNETCGDNYKDLYKDETMDSNFNKNESTRRIPMSNASEGDSLFKKKKKKKNSDKYEIMVQKDKHLKNDKSILNVVQFYNETIDDNVKYLNKINNRASNLNKEDFTTSIQIANASDDDKKLTLLKSPFKKIKKKKKKSKMAINNSTQSTKYITIQKNLKNMEDLKKNLSKEQPNEIHNDSGMINNPYNSRIAKVHPELFQKLLKKKKDKKKSIKVVTSKEVLSPKKSNKRKQKATDKEYSKDNSRQSVDMDIETCDSNNYIGRNKLKLFSSQDDHMSEYRTMTDIDSNMSNTIYNSRISKVDKEEYPELVKKSLKKIKREQNKAIKAVTRNEVMLQKKSNKHKRQTTDKEYSKNHSPQSVDINVDTCYDSNNFFGEDFGNKLELFDSRDDHPSEHRNIIDTVMYLGQYCNQIFNNANGIFIHENVLTGNIPLQCDICFRTFSCKSKLNLHKRTHTGEKPYVCNVCGQSYSEKGNLVVHKRTHTGEKPYACNICDRSFSHKSTLVAHKRMHTGEKPYVCNACDQSFSQKGNLVVHKRTHTGEKPYACNICDRSFSQNSTLVAHKRMHTGEKPFECSYCEKKFSTSSIRTRHTRNVHTKCF